MVSVHGCEIFRNTEISSPELKKTISVPFLLMRYQILKWHGTDCTFRNIGGESVFTLTEVANWQFKVNTV